MTYLTGVIPISKYINALLGFPDDRSNFFWSIVSGFSIPFKSVSVTLIQLSQFVSIEPSSIPSLINLADLYVCLPYGLSFNDDIILFTFPTPLFVLSLIFFLFVLSVEIISPKYFFSVAFLCVLFQHIYLSFHLHLSHSWPHYLSRLSLPSGDKYHGLTFYHYAFFHMSIGQTNSFQKSIYPLYVGPD